MAEFRLWGATWSRPELRSLTHVQRDALVAVGVQIADAVHEIDGFLPESHIASVSWAPGVPDLRKQIAELVHLGLLQHLDDPAGWLVVGWTDRVTHYRHGTPMAWGQRTSARIKSDQAGSRARVARHRGQGTADDSDATSTELAPSESPEGNGATAPN
jgi:hypothetical protein